MLALCQYCNGRCHDQLVPMDNACDPCGTADTVQSFIQTSWLADLTCNIACHDACNSLLHVSSEVCGSTDHRSSQINKICTSREVEQAAWAVQCHVDQRAVNKNGILDSSANSFCSNLVIGFHCHCYHLQHCQSTLQSYCHSVCSVCSTCSSDDCSCGSTGTAGKGI